MKIPSWEPDNFIHQKHYEPATYSLLRTHVCTTVWCCSRPSPLPSNINFIKADEIFFLSYQLAHNQQKKEVRKQFQTHVNSCSKKDTSSSKAVASTVLMTLILQHTGCLYFSAQHHWESRLGSFHFYMLLLPSESLPNPVLRDWRFPRRCSTWARPWAAWSAEGGPAHSTEWGWAGFNIFSSPSHPVFYETERVTIKNKTPTATAVTQSYWGRGMLHCQRTVLQLCNPAKGCELHTTALLLQESTHVPAFVCSHTGISSGHKKSDFAQIAGDYSSRFHAREREKKKRETLLRSLGRQTAHFYHEMDFYGCEGLTRHFQAANPMPSKVMRQDIKKKKTCGTIFKNTFLILLIYLSGNDNTQAINTVYDTPGSRWQAVVPHQNSQLS